MTVPAHLLSWARQPGPAKALATARERAERGRLGPRAKLDVELSADERQQVGRMIDAVWAASGQPVTAVLLRRGLLVHGVTLEDLLVAVGGPLRDLPAERRSAKTAKDDDRVRGLNTLRGLGGTVDESVLQRCLVGAPSWGERAGQIKVVVEQLDDRAASGEPPVRLPVLAAQLFRDAHALDRDRGLGRAVARLLAGRMPDQDGWADPVGDAALWHRAWGSGGVVCDGVSAQVLVLNLPLTGTGPAAALTAVPGEPVWLTLRSLLPPFSVPADVTEVFVCENPAIVEAAADRYGPQSRPLVCTFGLPNLATMTLLRTLAETTTLNVRADGDAVGWQIVERLLALPGARPWRMPNGFDRYEEEVLDELLEDLAPER